MKRVFDIFGPPRKQNRVDESANEEEPILSIDDENASPQISALDKSDEEYDSEDERRTRRKWSKDKPSGGMSKWSQSFAKKYPFIVASEKGPGFFSCQLCNVDRKLGKKGDGFIRQHVETSQHQKALVAKNTSKPLAQFIKKVNRNEEDKAIAAELAFGYHVAKHNFSLRSTDCSSKLIPTLFSDQSAQRFASARTKTAALIEGVIHPHLKKMMIDEINNEGGYFSLGLDATNHEETKLYAVVIRYLTKNGLKNRVLDIVSMASEKAVSMVQLIKAILEKNALDIQKMVSFTADNTNSNFGGAARREINNVFAILKKGNVKLLGIGCSSHISHNSARFATDKMNYDFESFALSIPAHFSSHAQRMELFEKWANEMGITLSRFPKHSSTRWLTLGQLSSVILKLWAVIELYFKSTDECAKKLKKIFNEESQSKSMEYKALFSFMSFILSHFNKFNCSTQDSSLTIPKLRSNVKKFKELINGFLGENFFGTETGKQLDELDDDLMHGIRSKLASSFKKFYTDALDYLDKWFAFLDDFSFMDWLQLDKELSFADVLRTFKNFISSDSDDGDKIFTEVIEIKENLRKLEGTEFDQLDVSEKWVVLFKSENVVALRKLVFALLSVFPSNAFCESVFSVVDNVWSDEKSRLSVELLNALVSVKCNSDLNCCDMYSYFLSQKPLLKQAISVEKYRFGQ